MSGIKTMRMANKLVFTFNPSPSTWNESFSISKDRAIELQREMVALLRKAYEGEGSVADVFLQVMSWAEDDQEMIYLALIFGMQVKMVERKMKELRGLYAIKDVLETLSKIADR